MAYGLIIYCLIFYFTNRQTGSFKIRNTLLSVLGTVYIIICYRNFLSRHKLFFFKGQLIGYEIKTKKLSPVKAVHNAYINCCYSRVLGREGVRAYK